MKTSLFIAFIFLLSIILNCSENSAGGSSSSENAKVLAGILMNDSCCSVEGVSISLFETDGITAITSSITGSKGEFILNIPELTNFTLIADYSKNFAAYNSYEIFSEDTLYDTLYLKKNGTVKIAFNEVIDTANDSIRILGTDKAFALSSAVQNNEGNWDIVMPNLPAAELSTVVISNDTGYMELTPALNVFEGESSTVVIKEGKAIHQWNVPLTVSVKQNIADSFGGLDSIKLKIIDQLDSASKIINSLADLPGEFLFQPDSFTTFTGSAIVEGVKPLGYAAHRLVYTDSSLDRGSLRELVDTRLHYLWLSSASYDFFKQWDLNLLVYLLSEGRGAMPLQYQNVNAGNYPINHDGYSVISSVMNKYSYSDFMTDYTKGVLLENRDAVGDERLILSEAIVDTLILRDSTKLASKLYVFASVLSSSTLNNDTMMTINAVMNSDYNEFTISKSIFLSGNNIEYGTLFLLSDANQVRWLTLSEAAEAWFVGKKNKLILTF